MADEARIEVGFTGGGATHVTAERGEWESLQQALSAGNGWTELRSRDVGTVMLNLTNVTFARLAPASRGIGFREE